MFDSLRSFSRFFMSIRIPNCSSSIKKSSFNNCLTVTRSSGQTRIQRSIISLISGYCLGVLSKQAGFTPLKNLLF